MEGEWGRHGHDLGEQRFSPLATINDTNVSGLKLDPALPFGGYRQSGIGRDFGVEWLDAYLETKTVCISH